ncbi:MAG: hypothetical protein JW963_12830 [Anaerolineales bacterium]|nr:hypothetical protein [Anaerolineales bacterium]
MKTDSRFLQIFLGLLSVLALTLLTAGTFYPALAAQVDNPDPPDQVVKLIFIHHSTGENWLTDGYGDLGRTLGENNYFVSDTNYGWGPDAIGDRTDIPNWMEWFRSADTLTYMNALFNESGQNAAYTRSLSDPGGENQISMFKSCFPNSELGGNPNDPPGTYEDMTVGGAKYVYNEILKYFATRPDKLFVVITAPPVSNPEYSANARAFNQWLVNDWLRENNYTQSNVAVFDFYNILTDSDAHHRFNNGGIEHVVSGRNTLNYPSGDDHPSEQGSRKATEEFVPLLNVFYHRWQADAPPPAQPQVATAAPAESPSEPSAAQPMVSGLIDDFETDNLPGANGWEPFWDEATPTSMHCTAEAGMAHGGTRSLLLDFDVTPGAWATCALFYESMQNWSSGKGLTFTLHAAQPGLVFDVDLYAGSQDAQETYVYTIEATPDSTDGWVLISLNWSDFHRADWEENAGAAFAKPDQIVGMAFGFATYEDAPNTGTLWVDDLSLLGKEQEPAEVAPPPAQPTEAAAEPAAPAEAPRRPLLPCGGAVAVPLLLVGLSFWRHRRK